MLEQGIVQLVQNDAQVSAIATAGGGYLGTLPVSQPLPSWTYLRVAMKQNAGLQTPSGLAETRLQIDCYGTQDGVVLLAKAINAVLNGYRGTLADSDSTYVDSCLLEDLQDFEEDPNARTYRRMIEYRIFFVTPN